MMYTREKV